MNKDMKRIIAALEDQGFEVTISSKGHVVVRKDGRLVTTFSGTPSDSRSWKNGLAYARRAGFRWPPD